MFRLEQEWVITAQALLLGSLVITPEPSAPLKLLPKVTLLLVLPKSVSIGLKLLSLRATVIIRLVRLLKAQCRLVGITAFLARKTGRLVRMGVVITFYLVLVVKVNMATTESKCCSEVTAFLKRATLSYSSIGDCGLPL